MQENFFPLPVSKIQGIGEKTADTLKSMGLSRVEELANCDVQILSGKFEKIGLRTKQLANGLDFGKVQEKESVKSISRHGTFAEDTNDPIKIIGSLDLLSESVNSSLLKNRLLFKTVTLTVRFEDFSIYTAQKSSQSGLRTSL